MKLFRYRPNNDLLYKELKYQEFYFASYNELNDPFDLIINLDFTARKVHQIDYLIFFLYKTTQKVTEELSEFNNDNLLKFKKFIEDKTENRLQEKFKTILFERIRRNNDKKFDNIFVNQIMIMLNEVSLELKLEFKFSLSAFEDEYNRITKKFLQNAYILSFSETYDNFLMWSHYSSRHSGVCLEFTLKGEGVLPFKKINRGKMEIVKENNVKTSQWSVIKNLYSFKVGQVEYFKSLPFMNFFDLKDLFKNENDLEKSQLIKFNINEYIKWIEMLLKRKTLYWEYENEWRAVKIDFDKKYNNPEDRIRHYPLGLLSGIYFGVRTTQKDKDRIFSIYKNTTTKITLYNSKLVDGKIIFNIWKSLN